MSDEVEGAICKRVNDGILLAGTAFGFGIDRTLGIAPAGLLQLGAVAVTTWSGEEGVGNGTGGMAAGCPLCPCCPLPLLLV